MDCILLRSMSCNDRSIGSASKSIFCLSFFPAQTGFKWVAIPYTHLIVAKFDLEDKALDQYPGGLDVLPAEHIGHLLAQGIEYFSSASGESWRCRARSLLFQTLELGGYDCLFGFPLPQAVYS